MSITPTNITVRESGKIPVRFTSWKFKGTTININPLDTNSFPDCPGFELSPVAPWRFEDVQDARNGGGVVANLVVPGRREQELLWSVGAELRLFCEYPGNPLVEVLYVKLQR